jgi:hypothetical protein
VSLLLGMGGRIHFDIAYHAAQTTMCVSYPRLVFDFLFDSSDF